MIELAPQHKRGLSLTGRVMNAAGILGFANEYRDLIDFSKQGAFITNPITLRRRTPARGRHVIETADGVLIHTGLPNPGVRQAIRQYAGAWRSMPCPVIVHIAGTTADDVGRCVEALDGVEGPQGVELGLPDDATEAEVDRLTQAAVGAGSLPVIVRTPLEGALPLAKAAARGGAQALTVAAPPRQTLQLADSDSEAQALTGRWYSRLTFPQALQAVHDIVAAGLGVPVIGCGGIYTADDALAMLNAGAVAVQVETAVWLQPGILEALKGAAQEPGLRAPC